jgi:plastocyanin
MTVIDRLIRRGLGLVVPACAFVLALAINQPAAVQADSTIQIRDLAFGPQTVTVSPGETVVWANTEDVMPHNVSSGLVGRADAGQLFQSPFIMPGDGFSYTFTEVGEYPYFCPLHPTMMGVVVVAPS